MVDNKKFLKLENYKINAIKLISTKIYAGGLNNKINIYNNED